MVFSVAAVKAPLKAIVPVVSVKVTVVAPTVLLKVVPPELVIVRMPISVPIVLETVTAPVVLMVRFALPLDGPVTVVKLIGVASPAPKVRLLFRAIAPVVISPVEVPPMVEAPPIVTAVLLSPKVITPVPAAVTVPFTVIALGAVATTPPVKFIVSEPLPKVTVPVLPKVVIPAIVLLLPLMATLKAFAPALALADRPDVTVRLPLKLILVVLVVSAKATVAALTVLLKVMPPELVMVRVPISVPIAPPTVTAPVVLIVKFDADPPSIPLIDDKLIAFAIPVPMVRVIPSAIVVAPKVMVPVALPPNVLLARTLTAVVPKLIMLVVLLAAIVPARYFVLGAVAVKPLVKVNVPPLAPSVKVPVLLKVTALVIVPVVAFRARLYA